AADIAHARVLQRIGNGEQRDFRPEPARESVDERDCATAARRKIQGKQDVFDARHGRLRTNECNRLAKKLLVAEAEIRRRKNGDRQLCPRPLFYGKRRSYRRGQSSLSPFFLAGEGKLGRNTQVIGVIAQSSYTGFMPIRITRRQLALATAGIA